MELKKILLNAVAFVADTQDLNIPADHVKYLDIGINSMNCGSAAECDWTTLPLMIDELQIKLGGETICQIHFHDLLALQTIWGDSICVLHDAGTAGEFCQLMGARIPLHVSKHGKSLSVRFIHADNASLDNTEDLLNVAYQYREQPFASHYNYQYREWVSAAAYQEINLDYAGAECIGILLYTSDLPDTTDNNCGIDTVKLLVDDREIWHESWRTMVNIRGDRGFGEVGDDAVMGGVVDDVVTLPHYRWLDFQQEPLPAGKLRMLVNGLNNTSATNRVVPVYVQKNQA